MQPAFTASPRMWLALGATIATAAGYVASRREAPQPAMPAMPELTEGVAALPVQITEQATPIEIVVVASKTKIARGEPLPLSFNAVNRSPRRVEVLRSLDASDMGWRYPKLDIEIRDASGRLVADPTIGRCGLVNPLGDSDFVELAPGARVDLFGEGAFGHYKLQQTNQLASGRYTVTLHYDLRFDAPERMRYLVDDARIRARVDRLPKGLYSSPPITIDVK